MIPITLPDLSAEKEPVRVTAWFVEPGDMVCEGDPVVEVLLPGVTFDVSSPVSGRIVRLEQSLDERVVAGDVLAWVEPDP